MSLDNSSLQILKIDFIESILENTFINHIEIENVRKLLINNLMLKCDNELLINFILENMQKIILKYDELLTLPKSINKNLIII